MSGRAAALLALVAVGAIVVGVFAMRPGGQRAAPSPTPSASPTTTTSPTPSVSPTVTLTATPSPTASPVSGRFVNAVLGYSIELTPPWRRSGCFSGSIGGGADAIGHDTFLTVAPYDETATDTGLAHGHVEVTGTPNPESLTPRQWWEAGRWNTDGASPVEAIFAGRPALKVAANGVERYLVANEGRMFEVNGRPGFDGSSTAEQRSALIASFRFLTPDELTAARAAPTPTPLPARSFEEVARTLADGFARKDVAVLGSVIDRPCVTVAAWQGGAGSLSAEKFMDELRGRFARGLTVGVRPTEYSSSLGIDDPTRVIESTWNEFQSLPGTPPGQRDVEVGLMVAPSGERWHWTGVLYNFVGQ